MKYITGTSDAALAETSRNSETPKGVFFGQNKSHVLSNLSMQTDIGHSPEILEDDNFWKDL